MNPNPSIIKLASGEALYANQALVKFIKSTISQASDTLVPEDSIFFFKNVKFKRDRLSVSQEKFSRTILLEKATAVVINTDVQVPTRSLSLVGNKIVDSDPLLADDIVYEISKFGSQYVEVIAQFFKLSQLSNKPKIIFEETLLEMINSGFVIDENNLDYLEDLLKSDTKMACQIIDSCDIVKSFPYILWLTFMSNGINSTNYQITGNCQEVLKYLRGRGMANGLTKNTVVEILGVPFLKDKLSSQIIQNSYNAALSVVPNILRDLVADIRTDMVWTH